MSHEPGVDRTVSVSDDGDVRVETSFARDEFPVPAIKFRLVSGSDDPVHVRLVDRTPEDFPMEGVGFHPTTRATTGPRTGIIASSTSGA